MMGIGKMAMAAMRDVFLSAARLDLFVPVSAMATLARIAAMSVKRVSVEFVGPMWAPARQGLNCVVIMRGAAARTRLALVRKDATAKTMTVMAAQTRGS